MVCLIFCLAGLVLAGPKSFEIRADRTVRASIEKVFKTLATIDEFSKAIPGITKVEVLTNQRHGLGTRFRETRIMNGHKATTELEVTEFFENERVRMKALAGGVIWDTLFTVRQSNPQEVAMEMLMAAIPVGLPGKLITPLILEMVGRAVQQDMDSVKTYCENFQ